MPKIKLRKRSLVGWVELNWKEQWKKGFPFKLWQKPEMEEDDVKIKITIQEIN